MSSGKTERIEVVLRVKRKRGEEPMATMLIQEDASSAARASEAGRGVDGRSTAAATAASGTQRKRLFLLVDSVQGARRSAKDGEGEPATPRLPPPPPTLLQKARAAREGRRAVREIGLRRSHRMAAAESVRTRRRAVVVARREQPGVGVDGDETAVAGKRRRVADGDDDGCGHCLIDLEHEGTGAEGGEEDEDVYDYYVASHEQVTAAVAETSEGMAFVDDFDEDLLFGDPSQEYGEEWGSDHDSEDSNDEAFHGNDYPSTEEDEDEDEEAMRGGGWRANAAYGEDEGEESGPDDYVGGFPLDDSSDGDVCARRESGRFRETAYDSGEYSSDGEAEDASYLGVTTGDGYSFRSAAQMYRKMNGLHLG